MDRTTVEHLDQLGRVEPADRVVAGWRAGFGLAVALAIVAGLASAALIPRGPTTEIEALGTMALGLLIGLATGALVRRRAAIVPVGLAHLAAIELGRLGAVGPTVDALRLDNVFGIIAFAVGRGLHGLLLVVPMAFGVAAATRLVASREAGGAPRRRAVGTGILGVLTLWLAFAAGLPGSTPPIVGPDGQPVPGSIGELATVRLGGLDQTVMIRAADPTKPVLLYLGGGPGQSDLAYSRPVGDAWVHDVVFVDWDQRGNGLSYPALEPTSTLTAERAVADLIELTDYLRTRFDEERIYLMGESWGTLLGVLAVRERPDLYHAFIGSGQMVNIAETDARIYDDLVAYATTSGNAELEATLAGFGHPPYRDIPWSNGAIWGFYDYLYAPYTPSAGYIDRLTAAAPGPYGLLAHEYGLIDKANALRGLIDVFTILYPKVQAIDLRVEAASLDVPVWVLDGLAELDGRRDLMLEWFEALDAPVKHLVPYEDAAHSVAFEQVDAVRTLLVEEVIPATYDR